MSKNKHVFNLLGDIVANDGDRWFESDVTPAMVIGWLAKQDNKPVEININSNGGDVAAGLAIANAIKAYKPGATCNVLGVAASMASVIACAGEKLNMGHGTFLMLHNPWTISLGNANDLRKDADTLDKMRDAILTHYQSKTNKTADDLKAILDAETWIAREETEAYGFTVGDYIAESRAAASITRRAFNHAPEAARAFLSLSAKPDTPPAAPVAADSDGDTATSQPDDDHPAIDWEARYKGASKKINELQQALATSSEGALSLQGQIDKLQADLTEIQTDREHLREQVSQANDKLAAKDRELAEVRNSLTAAESEVKRLKDNRQLLTAGVLNQSHSSEEVDPNKGTPEEREAKRAKKFARK